MKLTLGHALLTLSLSLLALPILAADFPHILSMQQRAQLIDELLNDKLQNTLPTLMRWEGLAAASRFRHLDAVWSKY